MDNSNHAGTHGTDASTTARPYSPPRVITLGRFADLTQGGVGSNVDGFGGFEGDQGTTP
jgi:hypothetical protein